MNFGSVCSGIEAATVAWHPLGWRTTFVSEIEPFPCAVLAHHYPSTPNHGDMTKYKAWPNAAIDVLVGGTPCQSFSIAGLRKGLADPRGNLMLTYGAIAARYRPRWLVWENVPGVLSADNGRAFGTFLGMLEELGYGFAYRVFDAQYFGLAQRRGRVFVVGHSGSWARAAAVLFECASLRGDPAPRRKAGQDIAGTLRAGSGGGCRPGPDEAATGQLIPSVSMCLNAGAMGRIDAESETLLVARALRGQPNASHREDSDTYVTHALRAEGFDASEDGTARGTPLVAIPFDTTQLTNPDNRSNPQEGDPCHTLSSAAHAPAIAYKWNASPSDSMPTDEHVTPPIRAGRNGEPAVGVRRLMPIECERLQGFPDNYTAIPFRKTARKQRRNEPDAHYAVYLDSRPFAKDSPRYKALGNSMAVPVMSWLGNRIAMVDAIP